jgi:hypothetical protein
LSPNLSANQFVNMAKLTMPLGSVLASGSFGKAIVYARTLGKNYARILVTPANPQSESQGNSRLLLGALGRGTRAVADPSDYLTDVKFVTPSGQTWVSYFISQMISFFGSGGTGVAALVAAFEGHAATNWDAQAATLGLTDLVISYASSTDTTISAGAQLYALAQHAMSIAGANPSLFDRAPYTTALASWDSADVVSFVADLTTVA